MTTYQVAQRTLERLKQIIATQKVLEKRLARIEAMLAGKSRGEKP